MFGYVASPSLNRQQRRAVAQTKGAPKKKNPILERNAEHRRAEMRRKDIAEVLEQTPSQNSPELASPLPEGGKALGSKVKGFLGGIQNRLVGALHAVNPFTTKKEESSSVPTPLKDTIDTKPSDTPEHHIGGKDVAQAVVGKSRGNIYDLVDRYLGRWINKKPKENTSALGSTGNATVTPSDRQSNGTEHTSDYQQRVHALGQHLTPMKLSTTLPNRNNTPLSNTPASFQPDSSERGTSLRVVDKDETKEEIMKLPADLDRALAQAKKDIGKIRGRTIEDKPLGDQVIYYNQHNALEGKGLYVYINSNHDGIEEKPFTLSGSNDAKEIIKSIKAGIQHQESSKVYLDAFVHQAVVDLLETIKKRCSENSNDALSNKEILSDKEIQGWLKNLGRYNSEITTGNLSHIINSFIVNFEKNRVPQFHAYRASPAARSTIEAEKESNDELAQAS